MSLFVFTYFHRAIPPLSFEAQEEKCVPISPLKSGYEVCGFDNPLNHRLLFIYLSVIFVYQVCSPTSLCFWLVSGKPQCVETLRRSWVFIDHCITLPLANIFGLSLWEKEGGREGGELKERTESEERRGREKGKLGGGGGGERVLVVRMCKSKNIHANHKNWVLLHQNWKCFLTKRYDKLEK